MEYRGGRMQGPPPHSSFRPRGGRGNNPINHHPVPNQHHHPSQVQPRSFIPAMNQAQWNPPNNFNTQEEGLNYPQPPYTPDTGYKNYTYHPSLPSPELINSTSQPQSFPPYPQQMFIPYMDPSVCYQQPPIVTTPPMAPPMDNTAMTRKFHYNSKDNFLLCSNCGHKNILAETEIIKRDERIDRLEKENEGLKKQIEVIMAENECWRSKLEDLHSQKFPKEEFGVPTEVQKSIKVEVSQNAIKSAIDSDSMSDEAKKQKQLSPDAVEFSPKSSTETVPLVVASPPVTAEVPVVSAKGMMDEDGDASTPVQGSEAGTQVEENLFEETSQMETSEVHAAPEPEAEFPNEDLTSQVPHANWSDEVEETNAQEDSLPEPKTGQVNTEVPPVAEEAWDKNTPVSTPAPEQNWRGEGASQNSGPMPEHWQQKHRRHNNQRGHNRFKGQQPPGFGRGKRNPNDQESYNDNVRPNYPHNRHDNRGYGNQSSQNFSRFQKPNEENWDNHQRDQRDFQRDGRNARNQRYGDRNDRHEDSHQRQSDDRENRSRDRENHPSGRSYPVKYEDKNYETRDSKDSSQKNLSSRERQNLEISDPKDGREGGPQGQGAWSGKGNSLRFNKEEKKEIPPTRGSPNQSQGNFSNKNSRQNQAKPEISDIVREIPGDLFSSPGDFSLAHCVAEDFRMGSGIAVKFKSEFKKVGELLDQNVQVGGCAHLQDNDRYIFYLVTKEVSIGKPRLEDLRESLKAMKAKCLKFGVKKLAMPRIGCGLDRLDWSRVKASINEIFQDTNIEIRVYDFNVSSDYYKRKDLLNKNSKWYNKRWENTPWPKHKRVSPTENHDCNLSGLPLTLNDESERKSESNEASQHSAYLNKPKHGGHSDKSKKNKNRRKHIPGSVVVNQNEYYSGKPMTQKKNTESESDNDEDNKNTKYSDKSKKKKNRHEHKSESDVVNQNEECSGKPKTQKKSTETESESDSNEDSKNPKCSDKSKKKKNRHKHKSGSDVVNQNKECSGKPKTQKKNTESESDSDEDNKNPKYSDKSKKKKNRREHKSESDVFNQNKESSGKPKKEKKEAGTESESDKDNRHSKYSDKSKKKKNRHEHKSENYAVNQNKESGNPRTQKKNCESESERDEDNKDAEYSDKSKKRKKKHKTVSESDDEVEKNKEYSCKSKKQKRKHDSKLDSDEDGQIEISDKLKKPEKLKKNREKLERSIISDLGENKTTVGDKNAQKFDLTDDSVEIPHEQAIFKELSHRYVTHQNWKVTEVSDKGSSLSSRYVKDKSDD